MLMDAMSAVHGDLSTQSGDGVPSHHLLPMWGRRLKKQVKTAVF
jgi:hypothetical protein